MPMTRKNEQWQYNQIPWKSRNRLLLAMVFSNEFVSMIVPTSSSQPDATKNTIDKELPISEAPYCLGPPIFKVQ